MENLNKNNPSEENMGEQESKEESNHLANIEFFRTMIFDTIREPLVVLDTGLIILSANEAFYRNFLVTPDDTRGKLIYEIGNHQWDIPSLRTLLERVLPQKETIENYEVTHEFPNIGKRTFLLNARQIHAAVFTNISLILLVFNDITERKSITVAMEKLNSELQSSNDAFESFGYTIAHDLRAPIQAIQGYCQILLEDFSTEMSAEMRGNIDRICSNASILSTMVSGLLELSRMTRLPTDRVQINLSDMARDITSHLQEEEPDRPIEFRIQDNLNDSVAPNIIRISLNNLLKNALKFTRDKSPAIIEFGAKLDEENRRVYFVKDNGIGFDMCFYANLFKMFAKCHPGKEFKGSGIGLALTKRAIEKHNGDIWAFSEPGKGATFFFTVHK